MDVDEHPCAGKRAFRDKVSADKRLLEIRHAAVRTMQVPRYSFECPYCSNWHLSSKPRSEDVDVVLKALGLQKEA